LDGAQELLTSLFEEPDRFCALATACPRTDVPVALAARGTRELREVPVHELLRLEPSLSAAST